MKNAWQVGRDSIVGGGPSSRPPLTYMRPSPSSMRVACMRPLHLHCRQGRLRVVGRHTDLTLSSRRGSNATEKGAFVSKGEIRVRWRNAPRRTLPHRSGSCLRYAASPLLRMRRRGFFQQPHKGNPPYPPLSGGQEKAKPPLSGGGASPFYTPLTRGVGGVRFQGGGVTSEAGFSTTPQEAD